MSESYNTLIIYHPNTTMAEIQTKARLLEKDYYFSKTPDDAPAHFQAMEQAMKKSRGVKKLEIGRHEIHIERYEVFEWDEVISPIVDALASALGIGLQSKVDDRRGINDRLGPDEMY